MAPQAAWSTVVRSKAVVEIGLSVWCPTQLGVGRLDATVLRVVATGSASRRWWFGARMVDDAARIVARVTNIGDARLSLGCCYGEEGHRV